MSEQRWTDAEIIKALRCCADKYCKGCSEFGKVYCRETIASLAWDLIQRQKAEIEKLENIERLATKTIEAQKKEIESLKGSKSTSLKEIESTVNEFWTGLEKLSMFKGKEKPTLEELLEYIEQVKVEAVQEFADRLTGIFEFNEMPGNVIKCHIDNLLAELTDNTFTKIGHNSLCETETYEG